MTPDELRIAAEAQAEEEERREKAEWNRLAWFTSILLTPYMKHGRMIDPEKLLPTILRKGKSPRSKEEAQEQLKELKKSVGMKDDE